MFIYLKSCRPELVSFVSQITALSQNPQMACPPAGKADASMKNETCSIGFAPELLSTV
jgi:hypothetical protein